MYAVGIDTSKKNIYEWPYLSVSLDYNCKFLLRKIPVDYNCRFLKKKISEKLYAEIYNSRHWQDLSISAKEYICQ